MVGQVNGWMDVYIDRWWVSWMGKWIDDCLFDLMDGWWVGWMDG